MDAPRHIRQREDLNKVARLIASVDESLSATSIKDSIQVKEALGLLDQT